MDSLETVLLDSLRGTAREGERRLGEGFVPWQPGEPVPATARFALLGIPEDIGVRANHGQPGSSALWGAALRALAAMPVVDGLTGAEFALVGFVKVGDLMFQASKLDAAKAADLKQLREFTATIDGRVAEVVAAIDAAGLRPIIFGGGHNNALGILRGLAANRAGGMACLNIDAHADLRDLEGRHSGNAFTAAFEAGILRRYAVLGLHEDATNEAIRRRMTEREVHATTLESLMDGRTDLTAATAAAAAHANGLPATLEVDLDCVEGIPASAVAASGLSGRELRTMVRALSRSISPCSLHVCEGIPAASPPGRRVARLAAELAGDFARAVIGGAAA